MSNPNNAIGTNGAFGGRTSVNAFNDVLSAFDGRGILSGWECTPKSGLTVQLGGDGSSRDVAIAEDPVGNKTTVNNISQNPVDVTIGAAPVSNSRIDSIVAYIEDSPSGAGETDNYSAVNLIVVAGTPASTPVASDDSDIRTAITADGGSGTTAYYVVLAEVTIASGTTDIDSTMIAQGSHAGLLNDNIADESVTTSKIANTAVTSSKIDWTTLYDYGTATLNSTYFKSGEARWQICGKVVILFVRCTLKTSPPNGSWSVAAVTGIPMPKKQALYNKTYTLSRQSSTWAEPLRLGISGEDGKNDVYFHWCAGAKVDAEFEGVLVYLAN